MVLPLVILLEITIKVEELQHKVLNRVFLEVLDLDLQVVTVIRPVVYILVVVAVLVL